MRPPQPPAVSTTISRERPLHRAAAVTTLVIAALYALIFAGVLSVGRAEAGELGILGVAGAVHLVLAAALWVWPHQILLVGTALLQLLLAAMYVAIAPERDPSYEVWGLTIRSLSLVLVVLLAAAFVQVRRTRRESG
jgi:hypothetical protein